MVVGVSDLLTSGLHGSGADRITTYALGSCIGFTIYDPQAKVGGLLHFMLPQPSEADDAKRNEAMYGSTGIPRLFAEISRLGARKERLILCAAGAAEVITTGRAFQIGQRNRTILRKILWKMGMSLTAEDTGGNQARTMTIDLKDGTVWIRGKGKEYPLWQP